MFLNFKKDFLRHRRFNVQCLSAVRRAPKKLIILEIKTQFFRAPFSMRKGFFDLEWREISLLCNARFDLDRSGDTVSIWILILNFIWVELHFGMDADPSNLVWLARP